MADIVIADLYKAFGSKQVLRGLCGLIPEGEITGLMAPSGAGKTTLLRILMGFEQADSGTVAGLRGLRLSAVFQEDRLCEDLDASANIRLVNPALSRETVSAALTTFGLADCAAQPVRDLSGGQRRRVSLLRGLLADYDLLLLDEPFKGLDEATKACILCETARRVHGRTVLLVTHDPAELNALDVHHMLSLTASHPTT